MKPRRLALYLLAMDALAFVGLFGSRPYLWCLERASDCTDWGEGADCGEGEPF